VVFKLYGDIGIVATTDGVDTYQVDAARRKFAEDRSQHESGMGNVCGFDLMRDVFNTKYRIYAYDLRPDSSDVMVTFAGIGKKRNDGHVLILPL
jgi:hypothetical protein